MTARIPASEFLIPCGDWNGNVGRAGIGYREVHGGMGYGRPKPDVEGERILEYALAFDPQILGVSRAVQPPKNILYIFFSSLFCILVRQKHC